MPSNFTTLVERWIAQGRVPRESIARVAMETGATPAELARWMAAGNVPATRLRAWASSTAGKKRATRSALKKRPARVKKTSKRASKKRPTVPSTRAPKKRPTAKVPSKRAPKKRPTRKPARRQVPATTESRSGRLAQPAVALGPERAPKKRPTVHPSRPQLLSKKRPGKKRPSQPRPPPPKKKLRKRKRKQRALKKAPRGYRFVRKPRPPARTRPKLILEWYKAGQVPREDLRRIARELNLPERSTAAEWAKLGVPWEMLERWSKLKPWDAEGKRMGEALDRFLTARDKHYRDVTGRDWKAIKKDIKKRWGEREARMAYDWVVDEYELEDYIVDYDALWET